MTPQAMRGRWRWRTSARLFGDKGWIDSAEGMAPHLKEERGNYVGAASAVVKPGSVEESGGGPAAVP